MYNLCFQWIKQYKSCRLPHVVKKFTSVNKNNINKNYQLNIEVKFSAKDQNGLHLTSRCKGWDTVSPSVLEAEQV